MEVPLSVLPSAALEPQPSAQGYRVDRDIPGWPLLPEGSAMDDSNSPPTATGLEVTSLHLLRTLTPQPGPQLRGMGEQKKDLQRKVYFATSRSLQKMFIWHDQVPDLLILIYFCNRLVSSIAQDLLSAFPCVPQSVCFCDLK